MIDFTRLLSDDLLAEAALASDVRSLWRRLARAPQTREVAADLAGDPEAIEQFSQFLEQLVAAEHDAAYLHPHDYAVCAGIVILEQSPQNCARHLIAKLKSSNHPSFFWVRKLAEYCDHRFAETTRFMVDGQKEVATSWDFGNSNSTFTVHGFAPRVDPLTASDSLTLATPYGSAHVRGSEGLRLAAC